MSLYIVPFIYSNFQSTKPQYNIACILSRMAANAFRFRLTAKKLYTTLFRTFRYWLCTYYRYTLLNPSFFVHVIKSKNELTNYVVFARLPFVCLMQRYVLFSVYARFLAKKFGKYVIKSEMITKSTKNILKSKISQQIIWINRKIAKKW